MALDLLGDPIPAPLSELEEKRAKRRRADRPKGYAAPPGSGPSGEFCRSCQHAKRSPFHAAFWKCGLIRPTKGPGTDIRLKSPACARWEKVQ